MKTAIYVRVSTESQAEDGTSIDTQIEKLTMYAEMNDWKNIEIYNDAAHSGSSFNRPAIQRLIADMEHGEIARVLIYKLDRLSRSQLDTLSFIDKYISRLNIPLISFTEKLDTESAAGQMMIGIMASFAQYELSNITLRMQTGRAARAQAGYWGGGSRTPFGYDYIDGELIVNELEATVVRDIFNRYEAGISLTKLRDELNEAGHIGKSRDWSFTTLRQVIIRPIYAGLIKWKGVIYEGRHEALISKEQYDNVQKSILVRQKRAYEASGNSRPFQAKYMLSGLLISAYSKAPLTLDQRALRKNATERDKYYVRPRPQGASSYTRNYTSELRELDKQIRPHKIEEYEALVLFEIAGLIGTVPSAVKKIDRRVETYKLELTNLDAQRSRLLDMYQLDAITASEFSERIEVVDRQHNSLLKKIAKEEEKGDEQGTENFKNVFSSIPEILENGTYDQKKALVRALIEKVEVSATELIIRWRFTEQ
ncbi:recombinase family protein [Periweissella cryptocerci]|nr:recombinase family protein [Periweissella cryptocerci]